MNIFFRVIILTLAISTSLIIIRLLIKKRISERISLLWIIGYFLIIIVSIDPVLLDKLSEFAGIYYPPSLLFLISTLVLLSICLLHSIQISTLNAQIRELTQYVVIKDLEHKKMDNSDIKYKEAELLEILKTEEDIRDNELGK